MNCGAAWPQSKTLAHRRNPDCIPQSFVLKFAVMNKPNPDELRKFIATPELPHLGPQTRASTEPIAALDLKLGPLLDSLPPRRREAVWSAVSLWLDHRVGLLAG